MTRTVVFLALAMMTATVLVAPAASANWVAGCYGNEQAPGRLPEEICAPARAAIAPAWAAVCEAKPDLESC